MYPTICLAEGAQIAFAKTLNARGGQSRTKDEVDTVFFRDITHSLVYDCNTKDGQNQGSVVVPKDPTEACSVAIILMDGKKLNYTLRHECDCWE